MSLRPAAQVEVQSRTPDVTSGVSVIAISGEVDLSNAASVEADLDGIVEAGMEHVVLDLSSLTFMDSSGIAVLVQLHDRVGTVEIRNPTPVVRRVLKVTGLEGMFGLEG